MCRFVTCCPHHSPMHIPLNQHQIVVFSNGVNAESSGLPSERPAVAVLSWAPSRRLWTLMEHSVHLAIRLGSPKKNSSKPTAILMVFDEFKGRKSKKCRLWKIKNKDFQKCVHLQLPPMHLENNMSQHCVLPQPYLNLLWDFAPQAQWGPSNDLKWSVGSIPSVLDNVCSIAAYICICICIHTCIYSICSAYVCLYIYIHIYIYIH